jgi:hypothetical protein
MLSTKTGGSKTAAMVQGVSCFQVKSHGQFKILDGNGHTPVLRTGWCRPLGWLGMCLKKGCGNSRVSASFVDWLGMDDT